MEEANLKRQHTVQFQLQDSEKGKTTETAEWLPRVEEGEMNGVSSEAFRTVKKVCMILWWQRHSIHLSKLAECTAPSVNPKVTVDAG